MSTTTAFAFSSNMWVVVGLMLSVQTACQQDKPGKDRDGGSDTSPPDDDDLDNDGWTRETGDCNDTDPELHPEAVDVPRNGVDEDCKEGDARGTSLADADILIMGSRLTEKAGEAVATGGDVDGDGLGDLLVGAPSGYDAGDIGRTYIFRGPVESGEVSAAYAVIEPATSYSSFGQTVAFVGDTTGDGKDDLVVGAPSSDETSPQGGAVFLFTDAAAGEIGTSLPSATYWGGDDEAAGTSVAGAGDIDGDGLNDVAIGSVMLSGDTPEPGRVNLWLAQQEDLWSEGDIVLTSDQNGDRSGDSVAAAGDVNGDGWSDLLIGAPHSDAGAEGSGKVWLVYGPILAGGALAEIATSFVGAEQSDYAGSSVSSAGDVDGDGKDDILCGGPLGDEGGERAGIAWLVVGPTTGVSSLSAAEARFVGESAGDRAGGQVASGLGSKVLAVGAAGDGYTEGSTKGLIYLWEDRSLAPDSAHVFEGEFEGDAAGSSIAMNGDVSGDGVPDLVIGAPYYGQHIEGGGAVYVGISGGDFIGF